MSRQITTFMTRKDLGYTGRKAIKELSIETLIQDANKYFKTQGMQIRLQKSKSSLLIRYVSPLGTRKAISPPGVVLSEPGVQKAREIAIAISRSIEMSIYSEEWLREKFYPLKASKHLPAPTAITWQQIIDTFEQKWLDSRSGDKTSTDRQKRMSLSNYLSRIRVVSKLVKFDKSTVFDASFITSLLALYPEGTDKRFRLRETLSVCCTLYDVAYNFKKIGKRPKPADRAIPDDKQIVIEIEKFDKIDREKSHLTDYQINCFKWLFCIAATYGLRPQELFAIDLDLSFKSETNYWIFLDESKTQGLKTGDRQVPPLPFAWLEDYDLTSVKYPPQRVSGEVRRSVAALSHFLRRNEIVDLYSLRHAYAIRCRDRGVGILDASSALGHDPATHSKHYHRHISVSAKIKSFEAALERGNS